MNWLLIGDPHAHPEYDNDRFAWLGRYIVDQQPDIIVCIGDFADMPSLSSYDVGKKTFEGRQYRVDVSATIDAQERLFYPMRAFNARQAAQHKRRYNPRTILTLGNHEDRINRAVNSDRKLEGTLSIDNLRYEQYWDEVVPFMETITVHNWAFSHYFATGVSGRPISGENIAKSLLAKNYMSSVQGHSHVLDYARRTAVNEKAIHGMSIGCYAHPEYIEGWNRNTAHMWWYGVVAMETHDDGAVLDLSFIDQKALRSFYA